MKRHRFTSIEFLVAVFILGLLAVIGLPSFHGEVRGTVSGLTQRPAAYPAPFQCVVRLDSGRKVVVAGIEGLECHIGKQVLLREAEAAGRTTYVFTRYLQSETSEHD